MKFIHKSAEISKNVTIGTNTKIWSDVQIRENVKIGDNCIIGKGVYIDSGIIIKNNVKIQNYACLYREAVIHDGVFIGPMVCLANDKHPRAINSDETIKKDKDWNVGKIIIHKGASIGAGSVILPDVEINEFALIGAGSVVTKSVSSFTLVFGNPAKIQGKVCKCGNILSDSSRRKKCPVCKI